MAWTGFLARKKTKIAVIGLPGIKQTGVWAKDRDCEG